MVRTHRTPCLRPTLLAASIALAGGAALAQQVTWKSSCTAVGNSPPEQLAGRDGQLVGAGNYVCVVQGGPMDGATITGHTLWHFEKGMGTSLAAGGIARKPGMHVVGEDTSRIAFTFDDKRQVTGFTGDGRTRFKVANGPAAALEGRTASYRFRATGPSRWEVDLTLD